MIKLLKKIILISPILSVVSCGTPLRQDIADFIANINYQNARQSVLKGHFIDDEKGKKQGVDFSEYEEMSFDISIENIVTYSYYYKCVNYTGKSDTEKSESIETRDGKYYYAHDEIEEEVSYEIAKGKTERFFYSMQQPDINYHAGGAYYGDMVKETITKMQDFITIDAKNNTLKCVISNMVIKDDQDPSRNAVASMDYTMDKLGMVLNETVTIESINDPSSTYSVATITATY